MTFVITTQLVQSIVTFPQLPNSMLTFKVTGKRVNRVAGYGLEIPVTYTCTGRYKKDS